MEDDRIDEEAARLAVNEEVIVEDQEEEVNKDRPVVEPSAEDARILEGAKAGKKQGEETRVQLLARIAELEQQLDTAEDLKREAQRLRRESDGELSLLKKNQLLESKKTGKAKKERDAANKALADGINSKDVSSAREWRATKEGEELRVEVDSSMRIHPDYECELCGTRTYGDAVKSETGHLKKVRFTNLRELAALMDIANAGEELAPFEMMRAMQDKVANKDTSMASIKKAYKKGLCNHALETVKTVQHVGIHLMGEQQELSDAITEVICVKGGRISRKQYVLIVPSDSVVAKLCGEWKSIEEMTYDDEVDMKTLLSAMETTDSFPKNLVFLLKNTLPEKALRELKAYFTLLVTKFELNVYIGADILPMKPSELVAATTLSNQLWLSSWRLENPVKNLVIISQFSATIWTMIPLVNIFVVARKESKDLLENGLMHVIEGKPFPFPIDLTSELRSTRDEGGAHKRPRYNGSGPGSSKDSTPRRNDGAERRCYKCRCVGHFANSCPKNLFE